jgi:hypothetical protein
VDTVELSSAAVAANATPEAPAPTPNAMPAAPTPDQTDGPTAGADDSEKATGHARVAQNFERHLDRMIDRAGERSGFNAADFKGMFDAMRKVFDAFRADASMRPSDVMKQIHQIMRDWRHGAPKPAPMDPPTPIDPPTPAAPDAKPTGPDAMPAAPAPDGAPVAPGPTPDEPPTEPAPIAPMPMAQGPGAPTGTDLAGGTVSPTRAQVTLAYSMVRATFSFSVAA